MREEVRDALTAELRDELVDAVTSEVRESLRVEGHVEAGGGTVADSAAMADGIAKELVLKGIDPKAIARTGQGDAKPLAGTAAGAKENRRVEVYLMPPG